MRYMLAMVCFSFITNGDCQYYFNDIVSTQETNTRFILLRTLKIKKIKAISFDTDNSVLADFYLEEEINLDGKKSQLNSLLSKGKPSVSNRTYELNKIKKTQTINNKIETKTDYFYSNRGLLQKLQFSTSDTAQKMTSTDVHEWSYTENGEVQSMLRIKDKTDSIIIELTKDEKGSVIEEKWKKRNRVIETFYYYYDSKNKLTDIVRYNAKLKKLLPDYVFEYDITGNMTQMTSISLNSSTYIVWKYTYTEKGLKQAEIGFDRNGNMIGKIEYTYE